MATYRIIKAQIAKLEKQAADLLKKEATSVIAGIRSKMDEYKLTIADLGFDVATKVAKKLARKPAKKKPMPPKYRDPVSGNTWNGHGKAPSWLTAATKKGKRDDFLIANAPAKIEAAVAPTVKPVVPAKPIAKKKPAKPAAAKSAVVKKKPAVKPVAKPAVKAVAKKPAAKPPAKKKPKAAPKKTVADAIASTVTTA